MRFAIALLILVGCGVESPSADAPTPAGTWDVALSWEGAGCGTPATELATLVTIDDSGHVTVDGQPFAAASGQASCDDGVCLLSLEETWPIQSTGHVHLHVEMTATADGAITGLGSSTIVLPDGRACQRTFQASGQRGLGIVSL